MGPVVATRFGDVEGVREGDLHLFRGIPFAAPPAGELRFAAPRPPSTWTGTRDATRFGPAAPQPTTGLASIPGFGVDEISEDCLTLNVWTPGTDDRRRPVMVWIHGGAFAYGSGAQPIYDGTTLAQRGDVVVVSINYRLGAFGFLHLGDLGAEFEATANAGLLDQVAALEWVRDNIEAFGGDPTNVTVFGESAGAMSVASLLGLPAASGLFRHAIAQSGAVDALTADEATDIARMFLSHLGLEPSDARKLLEVPVDAVLEAQDQTWNVLMRERRGLPFRPIADGETFPRPPLEAIADGLAAGVDLLVGTNRDEWRLFGFADPDSYSLGEAAVVRRFDDTVGSGRALYDAYAAQLPGATPSDIWFAIESDHVFRMRAVRLAEAQSAHRRQTYSYLFTWQSPIEMLRSCHALEIPFVFGTFDKPGMAVFAGDTPEVRELATKIQDAWLAFARTGDPNHPGLCDWPPYEPGRRPTMILGETCAIEHDPHGAEREAWADLL